MIVYLARDIPAFVMYCLNGESGSSLLIESSDSMIHVRSVCGLVVSIGYEFLSASLARVCANNSSTHYNHRYFSSYAIITKIKQKVGMLL